MSLFGDYQFAGQAPEKSYLLDDINAVESGWVNSFDFKHIFHLLFFSHMFFFFLFFILFFYDIFIHSFKFLFLLSGQTPSRKENSLTYMGIENEQREA